MAERNGPISTRALARDAASPVGSGALGEKLANRFAERYRHLAPAHLGLGKFSTPGYVRPSGQVVVAT